MLHRHVNVMEYIENNIAVLVTVYGINQERRHSKKRSNEHNYMSLVVRKPVLLQKHVHVIYSNISAYKSGNFGLKIVIFFLFFAQNIDYGYTLEPPRGGSNEYPRSMF